MNKFDSLSKFTLGTVQLGMPYGVNNKTGQPSQEAANEILSTALSRGVDMLDTAAAYGTSEQVIGNYLLKYTDMVRPMITTKYKLTSDNPGDELDKSLVTSLSRLGVDSIDVYMMHAAEQMTCFGSLISDRMAGYVADGRIGMAGVSVYTAGEIETFLRLGCYGAIQLPMGIMDVRLIKLGLIEELNLRGVAVFVRSVFTQGLIYMSDPPEGYKLAKRAILELNEIAEAEGMSLAQMAVSFIRDLPGVSSLVLGCETVEQVSENADLMDGPAVSESGRRAIMSLEVPIEEIMAEIRRH